MNISDVKYFKIHPSIGVARISNNDDYFEFFDALAHNFSPAENYMSKGGTDDPEPGKMRLKRQAVQFTIFAYGADGNLLGKLDQLFPDTQVEWTADVANRKLHNYSAQGGGQELPPVNAYGTARTPQEHAELTGSTPWKDHVFMNLGAITGKGLFIPAKGGVARKEPGSPIDPYPADGSGKLECTDTSCDGQISAAIWLGNTLLDIPIIPAWIVSAPGKHALSLNPVITGKMDDDFGNFKPTNNNANKDWLKATTSMLGITGAIYDPTGLDVPMMSTMNADYNPGMEVNLGGYRMERGTVPKNFFYPRGTGNINQNEIRVEKQSGTMGAIPGQLTSGLCSTWQGDMVACLNYWTAENPNKAYDAAGQPKVVIYQDADPNRQMNTPEEINRSMDFRGVVDYKNDGDDIVLNLVYDPNRP